MERELFEGELFKQKAKKTSKVCNINTVKRNPQ